MMLIKYTKTIGEIATSIVKKNLNEAF